MKNYTNTHVENVIPQKAKLLKKLAFFNPLQPIVRLIIIYPHSLLEIVFASAQLKSTCHTILICLRHTTRPPAEAAGIAKHRSKIDIHAGTRLHSYKLERAAHQSFSLNLVSDAYGNSVMSSRYSASSSELKLRQIHGLVSRRSKAPLLTFTKDR